MKNNIVDSKNIGENTRIWQFCVILKGAKIGRDCNICSHCFIENDVVIGDRVTIKNGVSIFDKITIEDDVFIGPNVSFCNDKYPRSKIYRDFLSTIIKKGASIGANATILPNIIIGCNAMIAAGSIVTKSVPDNGLWIKDKLIGFVCKCGTKINKDMKLCKKCKNKNSILDKHAQNGGGGRTPQI